MDRHFLHSSFRERLIEHLVIGELLKASWRSGNCSLEIARPEVDNHGYDIVAEDRGVIRHIQLKASRLGGRAASQTVNSALADKPSGCVVWVCFDEESLELGPFLYFGGQPSESLPELSDCKIARHTKPNAQGVKTERPALRRVPLQRFVKLDTIADLYQVLFVGSHLPSRAKSGP